jgi:hypothetical protein
VKEINEYAQISKVPKLQEEEIKSIEEVEASELPKLIYFARLDMGDYYSSHQIGENMSVQSKK